MNHGLPGPRITDYRVRAANFEADDDDDPEVYVRVPFVSSMSG